ncbi:hypothetical protein I6B53_02180 [Schaalia sp. 19OD2882]|uniref:hypothetical protein n=1 Tax=Schaalia sp. 19OD2882 TaxID=2794089 RepID=UPI001C1EDA71|nr:hypothetical protein [Schaalia sp. 19OD2882]QWW19943.1 hypothetical protein I6B53_02180 [Schaalia sp. 19OD2882]
MEYGGFVIAAMIVVVALMAPQMVARRTAITQSREIDRFSPHMRLLGAQEDQADMSYREDRPVLLPDAVRMHADDGETMAQHQGNGRTARAARTRTVRPATPAGSAVREISALRARRAARLSRESASGQRRMLLAAIFAVLTVGLAIAVPATAAVTWPWVFAGIVPLAAVLGTSRVAAVRSEAVGRSELEELRTLRAAAKEQARRKPPVSSSAVEIPESVAVPVLREQSAPVSGHGEGALADEGAAARVDDEVGALQPEEVEAPLAATGTSGALPTGATPRVERLTWSVTPVPAPTYARRGRVAGRRVHSDTDLRGIPKVDVRVPARPVEAQVPGTGAMSTIDVVASQAVALDLDAVLDARRAQ